MIAIETTRLFDGETLHGKRTVLIQAGRIIAVSDRAPPGIPTETLAEGVLLSPGFIDIQVNGGNGVLFNDDPDAAGLRRIAAAHLDAGTTSILPTLISAPRDLQRRAWDAVRQALDTGADGIAGIHIEGPFIARARRGIHPESAITDLRPDDLAFLTQSFPGVRLLTLAPEIVATDLIAALAAAGIIVSLGHSDAPAEAAEAALAAGAAGFTHLFNAMSQLGSRAPGVVGAALASATAFASIIADGHHVHRTSLRAAWQALGPARLPLISDAMPSVGTDQGFVFNGQSIRLVNGRLTDAAGTLAGAHLTMLEAVRNCVRHAGLPLADALRMATSAPADAVRLADRGRLSQGQRADLVALDPSFGLAGVWVGGVRRDCAAQTGSVSSA